MKMKKIVCTLLMTIIVMASVFAQTVTLTFTAQDAGSHYVQLNRVVISNQTKNWQETICWPDTVLVMQNGVGVINITEEVDFSLSQNNPNPFSTGTEVCLTVVEDGGVRLQIADANGRIVAARNLADLRPGTHQIRISLATAGTYVMTASQNGKTSSIKMVCNGGSGTNTMEYLGEKNTIAYVLKSSTTNPFDFGDMMEYVGYATINGMDAESEHVTQAQDSSQTFVMQFAENQVSFHDGQPCPGEATIFDYDSNIYNTVQIGNQCWMKENLRSVHYSNGVVVPAGTGSSFTIGYRYVPNNDESNVATYGYLYNWPAVMNGSASSVSNPSGVQGICPLGWHVPSDAEWTQLTNYVSSQSQYVCGNNSSSIAKALADTTGWNSYTSTCTVGNNLSANNATGFSAFPAGGYYYYDGDNYYYFGGWTFFWSSTDYDLHNVWGRELNYSYAAMVREHSYDKNWGLSVRCIRD